MKTWKKIVLAMLAVILIAVVGIVIWQWENISALYIYTSKTETELTQMAEANHENNENIIGKYDGITVKDISPEMERSLVQGEITVEEAIETITGNSSGANQPDSNTETVPGNGQESAPSDAPTQQQSTQNSTQEQPVEDKETQIINKYLEKIYIVKANFLGKTGQLAQEAKDEFYKFPLKERTKANKTATILSKLNECYSLESACDAEIESLLGQLAAELSQIGADTSVVDDIRAAYENDKSVKKAYYMQIAF